MNRLTTFWDELHTVFGDDDILENTTYVGRACYCSLGGDNRLKTEFIATSTATHYDSIRMHVINTKCGEIDAITIRLYELWGTQQGHKINPYLWQDGDELTWYGYRPTDYDYELLREQISDYAQVFSDYSQDMEQGGINMG